MPVGGKTAGRCAEKREGRDTLRIFGTLIVCLFLSACQSKKVVDNRPGWVREAEARLKKEPTWQTSGPGLASGTADDSTDSGFFGSGQPATGTRPTSPAATERPPAGVQWSDTQITVQVEE